MTDAERTLAALEGLVVDRPGPWRFGLPPDTPRWVPTQYQRRLCNVCRRQWLDHWAWCCDSTEYEKWQGHNYSADTGWDGDDDRSQAT